MSACVRLQAPMFETRRTARKYPAGAARNTWFPILFVQVLRWHADCMDTVKTRGLESLFPSICQIQATQ